MAKLPLKQVKEKARQLRRDWGKPRQLRTTVWAVNYASEVDWECLRDEGHWGGVTTLAAVNCMGQLYATAQEALDAGEAAWREDSLSSIDETDANEIADQQALLARLTRQNAVPEDVERVLVDGEDFVVLICARELKLPVKP